MAKFKCSGRDIPEGADDHIGVSSELGVGIGYDNTLFLPGDSDIIEGEAWDKLTREEALEIADIAIERWTRFKEKFSA